MVSLVFVIAPARADPILPGTPLGAGFGTLQILPGLNILPGPVVPGDLVMLENPLGTQARTNWSDVVRFFNFQTATAGLIGIAYHISDGSTGIPRIDILDENLAAILPDVLDMNNQFINEIQSGTGTDADITQYQLTNALYHIHSDAAHPDSDPEVFAPTPGQQIQFPGGGKGWVIYHLVEGSNDFGQLMSVKNAIVLGPLNIPGDTITITAQPGNPAFSNISLKSEPDDNNSPPLDDLETVTVLGDESGVSYLIEGSDVPEPTNLSLTFFGILTLAIVYVRRHKLMSTKH